MKTVNPRIYVVNDYPEELSWGFGKVFKHVKKIVKKPFKVAKKTAKKVAKVTKKTVKKTAKTVRKNKKLVIGGALLGAGVYAYKTGLLGKLLGGKAVAGKAVGGKALAVAGKAAKGASLLSLGKKALKYATSPAVLTTAAIATGSQICYGDKCYGVSVQQGTDQPEIVLYPVETENQPENQSQQGTKTATQPFESSLIPKALLGALLVGGTIYFMRRK
jgi:hypothetical protein